MKKYITEEGLISSYNSKALKAYIRKLGLNCLLGIYHSLLLFRPLNKKMSPKRVNMCLKIHKFVNIMLALARQA